MKTEMQQLKENTEREKAKDVVETILTYYRSIFDELDEAIMWEMRSAVLSTFAIMMSIITIAVPIFLVGIDFPEHIQNYIDLGGTVTWVVILRMYFLTGDRKLVHGKLTAATKILKELGWLETFEKRGNKRRKKVKLRSPFKRFKEFWERVGQREGLEVNA